MNVLATFSIEGQYSVTMYKDNGVMFVTYGEQCTRYINHNHAREAFLGCCKHAQTCAGWCDESMLEQLGID